MAQEADPEALTPTSPPLKPTFHTAVYGSFSSSSNPSPVDNAEDDVSINSGPRPGYSFRHQHRIIPPSISGHGRLIVAHREVPYWVGVVFVVGATAWAVWCAVYVYHLLGGKGGYGTGIGDGWG